jgi:hypothetical protein
MAVRDRHAGKERATAYDVVRVEESRGVTV